MTQRFSAVVRASAGIMNAGIPEVRAVAAAPDSPQVTVRAGRPRQELRAYRSVTQAQAERWFDRSGLASIRALRCTGY